MVRERCAMLWAGELAFLEAPRWHRGQIWASDVFGKAVYTIERGGRKTLKCEVPHRPAGIGFLPDGTTVIASMQDRKLLRLTDGGISVFADLSDIARGDLNDLVVDERGWVYVGNFGYDSLGGAPKALTDLHVVEPDGTIHIAAGGLEFPNGMVIINEGRTLVVAETWACRLTAFDRDAEGRLSNRRIFADLKTREPDGICVDASDAIWVASFNTGEFIRVLDGGQVTDQLRCGEHAISCAIGGEDGKTLFCSVFDGDLDAMLVGKPFGRLLTVEL